MKSELSYTAGKTKKYLGLCLAALVTVSSTSAWAQTSDVQKLQDENASLRRRLAELEGRVATPAAQSAATTTTATTTTTAPAAASSTLGTDTGVDTLSPFTVNDQQDTGYLRTNSVTATRINMPIQNIPLSVSVMSKDFIDDTNIRSITDVLRFSSSGAADNNFAMRRPANSATPSGSFTLRGFGVNSLLRNGISRYLGYNVNNVDRIEVVKGPASVFFGAGYPGGVINYITKQPVFAKIPTTISYTFGDNNTNRVLLDNNTQLSKKAAMRIVGSWENGNGQRNFEYNKSNSLTASLALVPFDSGKLKVTFEVEHFDSVLNANQGDWIYPDAWLQSYANPQASMIGAARGTVDAGGDPLKDYANALGGRTAVKDGSGATIGYTANVSTAAQYQGWILNSVANWIGATRQVAGDYSLPTYTRVVEGAYYTDKNGNRVHDTGFNYSNRGALNRNVVETPSVTVEFSPFSWLDARYVLTNEVGRGDTVESTITPYADGRTFNTVNGPSTSGYYRNIQNHQVDLIFKLDGWGVKSKLLVGGTFIKQQQQYQSNDSTSLGGLNYSKIPGITNAAGNPGLVPYSTASGNNVFMGQYGIGSTADVPVNQVLRDRFGNIKTVAQVFNQWDPGTEIAPDASTAMIYNRTALDGYKTQDQAGYINYNGSLLDDRLNILAGVRREMHRDSGQYLTHNFPWFSPPNYAFTDTVTYPPSVYGYDYAYAGDSNGFQRQAGTSWMSGLSFAITKGLNVFASYSSVFRLNNGTAGGASQLTLPDVYTAAKAWAQNPANGSSFNASGAFNYRGQAITSYQQFYDALAGIGAFNVVQNEKGYNAELGVKTSLWDEKLVGTFALFQSERSNQKFDDSVAQAAEPLNGAFSAGGNVALFGPTGNLFSGARILRWRTVGVKNRIQGADFEFVWRPIRNYQALINGSWMWTAKTVDNLTVAKPGTTTYNALTGIAKVNADLQYGERLENVPEYTLNVVNKYTFSDSTFGGLSLGANMRYKSETIISRSVDWNPRTGGLTSGNYLVFDFNVGYPWEVFGYKVSTSAGIYNAFDKHYSEGATYILSPGRTWLVTNTLKF